MTTVSNVPVSGGSCGSMAVPFIPIKKKEPTYETPVWLGGSRIYKHVLVERCGLKYTVNVFFFMCAKT